MKCKNFIFLICVYLLNIVIYKSVSVEMPFKKDLKINNDDLVLSNYNVDISISFQIGNNNDKLDKIFLKSDTHEFMLSNGCSTISNNKYDPEQSTSSKKIVYLKSYKLKYTSKAYIFQDLISLTNSENKQLAKFENIAFLYADSLNDEKFPGVIGLQLVENEIKNAKPLPCQFNSLKYSNNANWMIKYTNEDEGYFYIGDILNESIFPGFDIENFRKTNAVVYGNYLSWDLVFSQIKSNDIILNGPMQALLDFNFGLISCSKEYFEHIKKEYFNQYINKGKCGQLFYNKNDKNNNIKLNYNFTYIVCEKPIEIKDFPELILSHSALDYIFKFTYEDLFIEKNNKIYFLIINETEKNDRWKLGTIFFKKYNIIFDQNSKTIGIYDKIYSKSKKALIIFEWILVTLLIIIAIFFAYILIKRYRINNYKFFNRAKVDELEEKYDEFFDNSKYTKNVNLGKPIYKENTM